MVKLKNEDIGVRDLRSFEIQFDLKLTGRFEISESAAPAIIPQTMFTVQQKTSTVALL